MHKYLLLAAILLICTCCFPQRMTISGNVQDTITKTPLPYSVVMAVRLKDSVLVGFTRSTATGAFEISNLQMDTLELIVSNPAFGDQSVYIIGSPDNTTFHMGTIVLPPRNKELKEVVIYAFKDPVYYKGDTLIYTADSFKVKPNATVEDLLKKLPGIKVDQRGKITSQGRAVDQVLVDGDEFFGTDPTIATRNLAANNVESVQVFEKKDETNSSGENLQVMNLKLKDDAKKGYFGKTTAASDFQKFYEGEVFANKFKGTQKISIFTLASNTPKSAIGFGEIYKYGLDNENANNAPPVLNDDGLFQQPSQSVAGIPRTLKSGIYYNDRIGKKTKLNLNYTFNANKLDANGSSRSQYFLNDSTYSTTSESHNIQDAASHAVNMKIVQTLDSLTELEIEPKLKWNRNDQRNQVMTSFYTMQDSLTYLSDVSNSSLTDGFTLNTFVRLTRKFKNRERKLRMHYNYILMDNTSDGILKSFNTSSDELISQQINQKKERGLNDQTHNVLMVYREPLSKKIKLELEYNLNYNWSKQVKTTKEYLNGAYSVVNDLFSNSFENKRTSHRLGAKFIYETKTQSIQLGTRARTMSFVNTNLINQQRFAYAVNNLLPFFYYNYAMNENGRFNFRYNTYSNHPSIDQLQPIPDNANPLQVKLGNPDLKPTFNQSFNVSYNLFKHLSGKYMMCSGNFTTINNAFSNSIMYDTLGRSYTQTVNVNGNHDAGLNFWANIPFWNKKLAFDPNLYVNYSKNSNFINAQKNTSTLASITGTVELKMDLDTLYFNLGYNYGYYVPSSSLNLSSNKPYSTQSLFASLYLKLPLKFFFETSGQYFINSNRTDGYNINYVLWNATISKAFLKTENLILSFIGNDLLNQNINTDRIVQDNVITDTKTTIINRYFLLQLIYKFNNNKTKYDDNF